MSFSVDDLTQQARVPLRVLEDLSEKLPAGSQRLFEVRTFRKKRGGMREVFKPGPALDTITKNLYRGFLADLPYRPPSHVHGFVRGRSIFTNASAHLGKPCVLRVDLEDFFPSIRSDAVYSAFRLQDYDEKSASLATSLVTIYDKLPIGLSTSPFLSNLVFAKTDDILAQYAALKELSFTRYVDDLVFSGEVSDEHFQDIEQILNDHGWSINTNKTAFMRRGGRQYVTGLYVGMPDRPRIPRQLKREMRWVLHIIERFGYESYMEDFGGEGNGMIPQRLKGWAYYIAGIEPDVGYPHLRAIEDLVPDSYAPDVDMGEMDMDYI